MSDRVILTRLKPKTTIFSSRKKTFSDSERIWGIKEMTKSQWISVQEEKV